MLKEEANQTYKPAIIIPAFRRAKSLNRLLSTVNQADYPSKDIPLIISLDKGASEEVKQTAESFDFIFGEVQVIEHSEKLGVKDHIMKCADFAMNYGSIIVLEEDLIVSPGFYLFAQDALNFYSKEESVSGISLYSQRFNETAQLPFEPLKTGFPTYFMKLVCSWGQAWTAEQWQRFKQWYSTVDSSIIENTVRLPENIKRWSESSWKKYYDTYLIQNNRFIVYPFDSLSTHCEDEKGEHIIESGNLFQVPLSAGESAKRNYQFPEFDNYSVKYDTHMESSSEFVSMLLNLKSDNIAVDLYGTKSIQILEKSDYILTSKKFKNPIQSFPLQFKPLEFNMKFESYAKNSPFFYLYKTENLIDTHYQKPNPLRLAKYFSYQNLLSRTMLKRFLKDMFR